MKIVRKPNQAASEVNPSRLQPWRVLVVDDEPDIQRLTALNLRGFEFAGRPLELIEAASAAEAREKLGKYGDIALALIDVVMESDDAGLKLVEHIRNDLGNRMIRLVIRTGQPGVAPERVVKILPPVSEFSDQVLWQRVNPISYHLLVSVVVPGQFFPV